MYRFGSALPHDDGHRDHSLLRAEDRKERNAPDAPRGTQILGHVCCLRGGPPQPYAVGPGGSTFQFNRKAASTSPSHIDPLWEGRQVGGSNPWDQSADSGGNDRYNPFGREFLLEPIPKAWLYRVQRRVEGA